MKARTMTKGIAKMNRVKSVCCFLGLLSIGASLFHCLRPQEYYPMEFYFSSRYPQEVRVDSVAVLGRNVAMGVRSNSPHRTNNHYSRADCTPTALLESTADFVWWEKRFTQPKRKTPEPMNQKQKLGCSLPFPEFDLNENWIFHYMLQEDNKWVGQFSGVKVKPIGGVATTHDSQKLPDQQWFYVFIRNQSDKEIWFSKLDTKLVCEETETMLYLPNVSGDGEFHGFAAHSQLGSIYRPDDDSKISGVWGYVGVEGKPFEFPVPVFSPDFRSWYCYFTLKEDQTWAMEFEGVSKKRPSE